LRDWKNRNLEAERFLQSLGTLDATRRTGSHGVDAPIARALLTGFRLVPDVRHDHVEDLAFLPIADPQAARLRDTLVEATLKADDLDRERLATILAAEGVAGPNRQAAMRFSFTRPGTDPARARADLAAALEAAVAGPEIEAALAEATVKMKGDISDDTFADQQRLQAARQRYHDRLASLTGNG
jgi:DNA primase